MDVMGGSVDRTEEMAWEALEKRDVAEAQFLATMCVALCLQKISWYLADISSSLSDEE